MVRFLVTEDLAKYVDVLAEGLDIILCDLDYEFEVRASLRRVRYASGDYHWQAVPDMDSLVYADDSD
jgi:hypothetical protein